MTYAFPVWGNFAAMVSIYAKDGTVAVAHGGVEMGQGINTKVRLFKTDASLSQMKHPIITVTLYNTVYTERARVIIHTPDTLNTYKGDIVQK
jgi:xanthine dehydrogenase molybdopterin-binding subunit B